MNKLNEKIKYITQIALYSAFVVVSSKLEIRLNDTRIHLGNSMCLLSAFLLKPLHAGLASGLGSLIFDLLFYPSSFAFNLFFTFINKFILAFTCSFLFNKLKQKRINILLNLIISGFVGQISYIFLYLFKTFIEKYYFYNLNINAVFTEIIIKLSASIVNAIFAIILSTLLFLSLDKKIKYIE